MHEPWYNLAAVAHRRGDSAGYLRYLTKTVEYDRAPADAFLELADYHLATGNYQRARKLLGQALVRGAAREAVEAREQSFPTDRDSPKNDTLHDEQR
jgi:Tfp pilus assembly protein PilF